MPLKNINPTTTQAWKKLSAHFSEIKDIHLKDFFKLEPNRKEAFKIVLDDLTIYYSKNRMDQKTVGLLIEFANECELKDAIQKYFSGDIINVTENRAVLHTALRDSSDTEIIIDIKANNALINEEKIKIRKEINSLKKESKRYIRKT
jgi:glucose-6-phosphate isomerase